MVEGKAQEMPPPFQGGTYLFGRGLVLLLVVIFDGSILFFIKPLMSTSPFADKSCTSSAKEVRISFSLGSQKKQGLTRQLVSPFSF
jgi:hypothetical protein